MTAARLTIEAGVAELVLDNPAKLNALTPEMLEQIDAACAVIERDAQVRSVLLTAAGDRAFCVGADIRAWADLSPRDFARLWIMSGHRIFDRFAALPQPTIAVLTGHAFGGGLELAAACDLRIAARRATLALPETGVGVTPGWSGTQRLARQIPEAVLKEMALLGRRLTAERAHGLGFVTVLSDDPRGDAAAMTAEIAEKAPWATEIAKRQISAALGETSSGQIEALGGAALAAAGEKAEGVGAFLAKRPPDFGERSE